MPLTITNEMLTSAGLSEEEARLEISCWLRDAATRVGRREKSPATRAAALDGRSAPQTPPLMAAWG
jgi:hypothetical protein